MKPWFLDNHYPDEEQLDCVSCMLVSSHGIEFHIYQKPWFNSSRISLRATGLCHLMLGAHIYNRCEALCYKMKCYDAATLFLHVI